MGPQFSRAQIALIAAFRSSLASRLNVLARALITTLNRFMQQDEEAVTPVRRAAIWGAAHGVSEFRNNCPMNMILDRYLVSSHRFRPDSIRAWVLVLMDFPCSCRIRVWWGWGRIRARQKGGETFRFLVRAPWKPQRPGYRIRTICRGAKEGDLEHVKFDGNVMPKELSETLCLSNLEEDYA
jgi:hypothetical protein